MKVKFVYLFMLVYTRRAVAVRRGHLKCDGTQAETRFCLSPKRRSPFKSAATSFQSTTGTDEVCASAVVMLDTPCSEVVWRVLATHSIRQFPLHFPSCASPSAITFQMEYNNWEGEYEDMRLRCEDVLLPMGFNILPGDAWTEGCHATDRMPVI